MEEQKPNIEQILKMMAENLGEEPRPMVLTSRVIPEWIPKQAQERKFVFDLPHIPVKYKHLIMIAIAAFRFKDTGVIVERQKITITNAEDEATAKTVSEPTCLAFATRLVQQAAVKRLDEVLQPELKRDQDVGKMLATDPGVDTASGQIRTDDPRFTNSTTLLLSSATR